MDIPATLPEDDDDAIAVLRQCLGLGHTEAEPALREWVAQAKDAGRMRVHGHALCLLARNLALSDDMFSAEEAGAAALAVFESTGDVNGQAIARNVMSMLRFTQGDYAGALDLLVRALEQARPLGDAGVLCGLLNGLGSLFSAVGDPKAAATVHEECLALLPQDPTDPRRIGVRHNLAMALAYWAERERDAGQPAEVWKPLADRAVLAAESSLAEARQAGQAGQTLELSGFSALALAWLMADQPDRALAVIDRPEVRAGERQSTLAALLLSQTRARALIALGRLSDAVETCHDALARAKAMQTDLYTDELHLTLSRAHEAAGDYKAALEAHRQFHAQRARMVFERAERSARAMVSQLDLQRAQRESRIDPLTGVDNRRGFEERVRPRLSRARPDETTSLMLIDIDHFKQVNDTQGHAAGDNLLRTLAAVLHTTCRGSEQPARLGGDEFVVLVEGGPREALALAHRIRIALEKAQAAVTTRGGGQPACTVSIGIASVTGPRALDDLLARADQAMYSIKHGGRDGVAAAAPM